MAARKPPVFTTATTFGRLLTFLGVSVLCGVLTAGLFVPMAAGAGSAASASITFFDGLPADLERATLAQPTRILASDDSLIATLYEENRQPVTLDQISPHMVDALLSVEDYRYYEHGGVDVQGIFGAIASNVSSGTNRGASTITQQFVTNVLANGARERGEEAVLNGSKNISDKVREVRLAIAVENEMSKEEILEGYLNIVSFTGDTYGVQAAAKYLFNVDAKDLNIEQSALLAGLVKGPSAYDPQVYPEAALERRNLVLGTMLEHGKIDQAQYDAAIATGMDLNITPTLNGCVAAEQAPYFCSYVEHLVLNSEEFGDTPEERSSVLYRSGLTIKTTLDPAVQQAAQAAVNETANPDTTAGQVGHSMISLQPGTGNILSMAQNTRFTPGENPGDSMLNFNVDQYQDGDPTKSLGGIGGFQPGSTFKPFTVAAWVDAGKSLGTQLDGRKKTYPQGDRWTASCLDGGAYPIGEAEGWTPQNYGDTNYGDATVLHGLAQSLNTITFSTAKQLDLCRIMEIAESMGVHNGKSASGQEEPLSVKPSALIGGVEDVSPMAMAQAFAGFAAEGNVCEPRALVEVTDVRGKTYDVPEPECEQVISKETARGVNYATQEVMKSGSGSLLNYGFQPMAGKTGTNDSRSQTWFIGYNSGMATASWIGNWKAGTESLSGLQIGGRLYPEIDGSLIAAPSWAKFMQQAGSLYPGEPFANPPGNLLVNPSPSPSPSESEEAEEDEETAPKPSATAVPRPAKATPTPPAAPPPAVETTEPAASPAPEAGGAVTPSPGATP
ncbi:transglycosylase domain-containing protein [Arthrobacter caoxuetaonis]|uniref:Penicillin-binding protein n=1 Tax=Arthrobacter caoxuetaonis TaxID=2886935 RepID=A0A9X1MFL7_9MICC|nr:transglycosylase domain-containing protein [Arthrobacter caoxuetaonis]MCC3298042.1 penicillin-binding protein [Arthrobacter caoxuetaonis]USQ57055.1 penicillin-binding protein [Arthrobacter caoxuetaonis]